MFWSKKRKLKELEARLEQEIQKLIDETKSDHKKIIKEKYKFGDVINGKIFITSNVQANFVYYCYDKSTDSLEYVTFKEDRIREQVLEEIEELKKGFTTIK